MANAPDHYKVLGLKRSCTSDEIKKAYEELTLAHSPDKNPEDKESEEKTKAVSHPIFHSQLQRLTEQIKIAHEILSDREKRRAYDVSTSTLRPDAPAFQPDASFKFPQVAPKPYSAPAQPGNGYYPQFNSWSAPMSNAPGPYKVPRSFDYQVYQPTNNPQDGYF